MCIGTRCLVSDAYKYIIIRIRYIVVGVLCKSIIIIEAQVAGALFNCPRYIYLSVPVILVL